MIHSRFIRTIDYFDFVPYIVQPPYNQPYNQPWAGSTHQMTLPQRFSTPVPTLNESTYTPSRYQSTSTGRPAGRPQVYSRPLHQPPYYHTASSLRGNQSLIPTHTVPAHRSGLRNPNSVQVIRPRVNVVTHTRLHEVATGNATPCILQTQNILPSGQNMSPEVSRLLQTMQSRNSTRNSEITIIDLADTDSDNDTQQGNTRAPNDSHVELPTTTATSPVPMTCDSDDSQIHGSEAVDLESNSLDTTAIQEDTSSNIISINPVSGNTSDDDSTNELLNELNIDLKSLTSANTAPEINTTVNTGNKSPKVDETCINTPSTGNVACKSPLLNEMEGNKPCEIKTVEPNTKISTPTTKDLNLNSPEYEETDSKLDVKPSIEALQIKVEKNLELNAEAVKTEPPVNVKIENATQLEKFVDIPTILSKDVAAENQLVMKNESDISHDDISILVDFSVIDVG